jgi:hypothetical protein
MAIQGVDQCAVIMLPSVHAALVSANKHLMCLTEVLFVAAASADL